MGSASSTIVLKNQLNHEALLSFDYFLERSLAHILIMMFARRSIIRCVKKLRSHMWNKNLSASVILRPVTTTEFKNECRTEYDEVCSSKPRTECNAVQKSVPHTVL